MPAQVLNGYLIYSNLSGGRRPSSRESAKEIYRVTGYVSGENEIVDVFGATNIPSAGDYKIVAGVGALAGDHYNLYVLSIEARSLDPVSDWEVTVNYVEDPANILCVVNRYASHKPYPIWGDNDGHLPRNVVGDPFMPPLMRTRGLERVEVSCRISKATRQTLEFANYVDHRADDTIASKVNLSWSDGDDDVQTLQFDAVTVYLDDIRETTIQEPYTHYQLTLLFLIDTKQSRLSGYVNATATPYAGGTIIGWQDEIPNAGPQFSTVANTFPGNLRAIHDDVGVCMNGIGLLKLDGTRVGSEDLATGILVDGVPKADMQGLLDTILDPGQWIPAQGESFGDMS